MNHILLPAGVSSFPSRSASALLLQRRGCGLVGDLVEDAVRFSPSDPSISVRLDWRSTRRIEKEKQAAESAGETQCKQEIEMGSFLEISKWFF